MNRPTPTTFHALVHLAILLILTLCSPTSGAAVSSSHPTHLRRDDGEHVVLADCIDSNRKVSSQVAYFPGTPNSTPQDVALVSTPEGQARIWAGNTTRALFTDTGVVFIAKLGPLVGNGQFAGTGNNGYGDFTCWQSYVNFLYQYGDSRCSQVYDCDHRPVPSTTPAPAPVATTGAAHSGTPDSGLSTGTLAGIICGVVGAVLLAALAAWLIWRRHLALIAKTRLSASRTNTSEGGFSRMPKSPSTVMSGVEVPKEEDDAHQAVFEMDGTPHTVVEMANDRNGGETPPRTPTGEEVPEYNAASATGETVPQAELDSKDRMYMQYMGRRK